MCGDGARGGPKYSYLSSTKYGGPGPGTPPHFPLGITAPVEILRLTEGPLKADIAYVRSGLPTIRGAKFCDMAESPRPAARIRV